MNLIKAAKTAANKALLSRLLQELESKRTVLWLVSGGSNIAAGAEIMQSIPESLTPGLTVGLVDERYGPIGHTDSNWQQLLAAGFNTKKAKTITVLEAGLGINETGAAYASKLSRCLANSSAGVALLGMGTDGHIAGILPGTVAADTSNQLVSTYAGPDHQRITVTIETLRHMSAIYVFAFGQEKVQQISRLQQASLSLSEQPAQYLKQHPEVYLYNEQLEGGV